MASQTEFYALIKPGYADVADIAAINQNTDTIDAIMHGSQISLAPAYDPANTYNTGDKAVHDYALYKCKYDNITGTWDGTKWERTTATAEGGTEVEANPAGTPAADLSTLGIAGTVYGIPSGGDSVEANPAGAASDTLNKLGINGTVYEIQGGGGGGGSADIQEETIWTNTTGAGTGTYTLSKSINEFDFIAVRYGLWSDYTGATPLCECQLISVKDLQALHTDGKAIIFTGYANRVCYADFNGTNMTVSNVTDGQIVLQVNGVKMAGMNVSEDLAAGTWTQLISQAGGAWSADTAVPADATHVVVVVYYQSALYMPLTFRIADYDKLADVTGEDIVYYGVNWEVSSNYDKIQYKYDAANRTVGIYAAYNGITIKAYAVKAKNAAPGGSEIIPITTGDGTNSRTFTLSAAPTKISLQGYTTGDGGWYESGWFIWGQDQMCLYGAQGTIATGGYAGLARITYGADGKSFTITAANAFGAFNRADNMSGSMLVEY